MPDTNIPNECECCPTTRDSLLALAKVMRVTNPNYDGDLKNYHGMWMCPKCYLKEIQLQNELKATAENRVNQARADMDARVLIEKARQIDESIQLSTDIFNAKTVSIMEIKSKIDSDDSITNKQFALAEFLTQRHGILQASMQGHRKALAEEGNEQRAIQTYLNTLANQLRQEERDKLKLQDISYSPDKPKVIKPKKDKKPRTSSKFDVKEMRNLAAQYNVPMEMIQAMAYAKNMNPGDAAKECSKMLHGK